GRTLALTKGKGTTCNTYDAEGRLISQRTPGDTAVASGCTDSSATACFTYDPAGNQRSARNASGIVTLTYDEDGHVIDSGQADASSTVFGETSFTYTAPGVVSDEYVAAGPLATSTNYHYRYTYDTDNEQTATKIIDSFGGSQNEIDEIYDN